jgi:hypothetical protein
MRFGARSEAFHLTQAAGFIPAACLDEATRAA